MNLPLGFSDRWGEDLKKQRLVETIFRQVGYNQGYFEVETPVLEPMSALPREAFSLLSDTFFIDFDLKDYDAQESVQNVQRVAMRPEGTLPICRFLAQQLGSGMELPQKLIYTITCYRNEPVEELDGFKLRQFGQLGAEFIGDSSLEADVEVIKYACDVLRGCGVPDSDFRVRVNNVGWFKRLCDEAGLSPEEKIEIQDKLDNYSKARASGSFEWNYESLPDVLSSLLVPNRDFSDFGDLDKTLVEFGKYVEDLPVEADPTVVRGFNYYTGLVFQVDVKDANGQWVPEVGGGGRYDELIGNNLVLLGVPGKVVPATGFAFGTERLAKLARLKGKYTLEVEI